MVIEELDTPAVLIEQDVMERNLSRMAAYCRGKKLQLRPHIKTHKIPELAQKQMALGACGITVAKTSEARVMIEAGIRDVLVAYPIATDVKARELVCLAEKTKITVSLDSVEVASTLSRQASVRGARIGVLVELDVGFGRCGVFTDVQACALAQAITKLPSLELRGLMFYPGHMLADENERRKMLVPVNERIDSTLEALHRGGYATDWVSGGSTPTAYMSHEFHGVTEIRPGMYLFYDRNMLAIGACRLEDCAVTVAVTVVSTAVSGRCIVDGGSKTFSSDRLLVGEREGYGLVLEDPDAQFITMSEEHGHLDISRSRRTYRIGERLSILPNHVCATINMHDQVYATRGGKVENVWRVAGRGKLQ
jgi:D-serine deaminase-like pyridoxal phosphate-dependent protein